MTNKEALEISNEWLKISESLSWDQQRNEFCRRLKRIVSDEQMMEAGSTARALYDPVWAGRDETKTTYATGKFSPCCDELIRVGTSDEGTNWYECSKCGRAV